jgi:hypothetical protein
MRECRRRSRPVRDAVARQLCEELRRAMGVHRPVELRELLSLNTAATLGCRRPVILLPADWRSWDLAEQTSVVAHELAHISRGDYARWLLAQLTRALHGYQPLLHALTAWLRREQELTADAVAARFAGGPALYTQALCRLALRRDDATNPGLARAFLPAHLSVTRRLQMLLCRKRRSEPMMATKWRVGLGFALVAGCLTIAGLRSPARAEPPRKPNRDLTSEAAVLHTAPITTGKAQEWIEQRLNERISVEFAEIPLSQALDEIRELTGIPITVDRPALEEDGIDLQHPVSLKLDQLRLKTALQMLLRDVGLTWVIKDDVVEVTTPKGARGKLVQRTYAVADLVVPIPNYGTAFPSNPAATAPATPSEQKTDEQQLIRCIVNTIAPNQWREAGGPGTIEYFPLGMALVVNQTTDVHEQVAELLDALRRLQDLEVSTEIRLVRVSTAMTGRLERDFGVDCSEPKQDPDEAVPGYTFLEPGQVEKLLETVRADRGTKILQTPRLTLFNGQSAMIQCEDPKWDGAQLLTTPKMEAVATGSRFGVQAVVSGDRRFVRLHLQAQLGELDPTVRKASVTATQAAPHGGSVTARLVMQELEQPTLKTLHLETTVCLPDGGTAALTGWKWSGARPQHDGRGAETQCLLLLVTPRIRISSENAVSETSVTSAAAVDEVTKMQKKVQDLLGQYQEACRERRFDEARKLAAEALMLDPACFSQGR